MVHYRFFYQNFNTTTEKENNPNKTKHKPQIKPLCSLHIAFILPGLTRVSRIGNIKRKSIKQLMKILLLFRCTLLQFNGCIFPKT